MTTNGRTKQYDGHFGSFSYRAGRTAGCFNIFRNHRYVKSVTNVELSELCKKASGK